MQFFSGLRNEEQADAVCEVLDMVFMCEAPLQMKILSVFVKRSVFNIVCVRVCVCVCVFVCVHAFVCVYACGSLVCADDIAEYSFHERCIG